MPISQETMLRLYGHLCDLGDLGEALAQEIAQGDLFKGSAAKRQAIITKALTLAMAAQARQRQALGDILGDDTSIDANPITGRLK